MPSYKVKPQLNSIITTLFRCEMPVILHGAPKKSQSLQILWPKDVLRHLQKGCRIAGHQQVSGWYSSGSSGQ